MNLPAIAAELCLAIAACLGAFKTRRGQAPIAPAGFLLFAAAAGLGALTYAGFGWAGAPHDLVTRLTEWAGLALIAIGLTGKKMPMLIAAALLVALAVVTGEALLVNIAALLVMIVWAFWSTRRAPWPIIVAALLFALAGLAIGTHGQVLGLPRVDLYHVTLAVALLLLATA
jgi:hypothetical protein